MNKQQKVFYIVLAIAFSLACFSKAEAEGKMGHPEGWKGKRIEARIAEMDSNKDGAISKDEWTKFHEEMFKKQDKNNDGSIDKTERQLMRKMHRSKMKDKD